MKTFSILKEIPKNLFFSFFLTVVFFLTVEALTRVYLYIKNHNVYYLYYGTIHKASPNLSWNKLVREKGVADNFENKISIAVFGGSTTKYGSLLPNDNYPEVLAEITRSKNADVVNLGSEGMESNGELERMKKYLLSPVPIPKIIFVYSGLNDAINTRHLKKSVTTDNVVYYIRTSHIALDLFTKLSGILERSSILYAKLMEKTEYIAGKYRSIFVKIVKKQQNPHREKWERAYDKEVFVRLRVKRFSRNMQRMINICKRHGIKIYFGTTPLANWYRNKYPDLDELLVAMYKELLHVCEKNDIPLIDISSKIYSLPAAAREKIFQGDGIHMKREGNKIIAEIIYNAIEKDIEAHGKIYE